MQVCRYKAEREIDESKTHVGAVTAVAALARKYLTTATTCHVKL